MSTQTPARRLTVDGEVFEVRPSDDGHGFAFDWLTGPHPGYGFSSGTPITFVPDGQPVVDPGPVDDAALIELIRSFLARIDPDTGHVAD